MDLNAYINRFNGRQACIRENPSPNLCGVIVIPCFCEPDWKLTLQSLVGCEASPNSIEVLIVLNDSETDAPEIHTEHQDTFKELQEWSKCHQTDRLRFHAINALNLPKKHAGVGLARKIGMDEALYRLNQAGNLENGWIAGLDADCLCQSNYLESLETHFKQNPTTPGCSIHFEHPLEGSFPLEIYTTAAKYELHLRYYVEALRYAGFPHAYHTIGSSMAARPKAYMAQGGMNRRQAGEDFYFLNKIISLGNFTELTETTVIPSPRTSDRVPFGTGRAVAKYYGHSNFPTYAWKSIIDLKHLFNTVRAYDPFQQNERELPYLSQLPTTIVKYLDTVNGWDKWQKCIDETKGFNAYLRRFFSWFDAFQCMKCLHFMRDNGHGEMDVGDAARLVLETIETSNGPTQSMDEISMLKLLRDHQKQGSSHLNS